MRRKTEKKQVKNWKKKLHDRHQEKDTTHTNTSHIFTHTHRRIHYINMHNTYTQRVLLTQRWRLAINFSTWTKHTNNWYCMAGNGWSIIMHWKIPSTSTKVIVVGLPLCCVCDFKECWMKFDNIGRIMRFA